jgi:hypothetical protein
VPGRPPGLRSIAKALGKLSPTQLRRLLSQVPKSSSSAKVDRLRRVRQKHVDAIQKLDRKIAQLSGNSSSPPAEQKRGRRKMSAETRRKMSASAKRRYARMKTGREAGAPSTTKKTRRSFSPETRAKMAEAARKRWAKLKEASGLEQAQAST